MDAKRIMAAEYSFPHEHWRGFSADAQDSWSFFGDPKTVASSLEAVTLQIASLPYGTVGQQFRLGFTDPRTSSEPCFSFDQRTG